MIKWRNILYVKHLIYSIMIYYLKKYYGEKKKLFLMVFHQHKNHGMLWFNNILMILLMINYLININQIIKHILTQKKLFII